MIGVVLVLLGVSSALGVSQECADGQHTCKDTAFCVENKFCMPNTFLGDEVRLFTAGVASAFVESGNGAEAKCFVEVSGDVENFVEALTAWEQGEFESSAKHLYKAVSNVQSIISNCVTENASPEEGFWGAMWHGFEAVLAGLCPACDVLITDAEYVIQGVDIIDDWMVMGQNCYNGASADEFMACGAAFGDSVQRIAAEVK